MARITRRFLYVEDENEINVGEVARELRVDDVVGGDTTIAVMKNGEDNTIVIPNEVWNEITGRGRTS